MSAGEELPEVRDLNAAPDGLDAFLSEDAVPSAPAKPADSKVTAPPVEATSPPVLAALPPAQPPERTIPPPSELSPPDWFVIEPPHPLTAETVARHLSVPEEPLGGAAGARRLGLLALTLSLVAAIGWLGLIYQRTAPLGRDRAADMTVSARQSSNEPDGTPSDNVPLPSTATPTKSVGTAGVVSNVSGTWTLATQLESTSYARFSGLKLGYEIQLQQAGDQVTGAGRKVTENGGGLRQRAQTPISVAGTIERDRLTLAFTERGARRPTEGKFVLLLEDDGAIMRGRFSSTAAQSSGTVEAKRVR